MCGRSTRIRRSSSSSRTEWPAAVIGNVFISNWLHRTPASQILSRESRLYSLDLNCSGFCLLCLRQFQRKHTVLHLSRDLALVNFVGEAKAPGIVTNVV